MQLQYGPARLGRVLGHRARRAGRRVLDRPLRNGGLLTGSVALVATASFTGVGGPPAVAGTARTAAVTPAPPPPPYVVAAEGVAGPFIAAFESYSYSDSPDALAGRVAPYTTSQLQTILASPSQGGVGAALSAEQASAAAAASDMQVETASSTQVSLLATVVVHVTSANGNAVNERYVPLTLVSTPSGWRVSDVDSLIETTPVPAPPAPAANPPAGSSGSATPPAPAPAPSPPATTTPAAGTPGHVDGVPDDYLHWYEGAATTCPGLSWTILAAVGTVESDNGHSTLPGVHSGSNSAGAEGPMQFMPGTWAAYATVAPGGADPADVYDPADAIWSAARLLCADGAGNTASLYSAIFDYNHSDSYVSDVLTIASRYAAASGDGSTASDVGLGSVIVHDAESYVGTPYVWGGENPGGFDCSGLVQWVYAQAGVDMPRVAQDQYDAGPHLAAVAQLYAGDLVFFGSGPDGVEHVGIYVGNGNMIDAPHPGAVVRVEPVAGFDPPYVGATRPEIPDLSASGPGLPVVVGAPGSHRPPPGGGSSSGSESSDSPDGNGGSDHQGSGHHHPTTTTTTVSNGGRGTGHPSHPHPGGTTTTTVGGNSGGSSAGSDSDDWQLPPWLLQPTHPSPTSGTGHRPPTTSTTATPWHRPTPPPSTTRSTTSTTSTSSTGQSETAAGDSHHPHPTGGSTATTHQPTTATTPWHHPTTTTTRPPSTTTTWHHPTTTTTTSSTTSSSTVTTHPTTHPTWPHPGSTTTSTTSGRR